MSKDIAFQLLNQETLYFNMDLHTLSAICRGTLGVKNPVGKGKLKNEKFYTVWVVTEKEDRNKPKLTQSGKHTLRLCCDETKESLFFYIDVSKLIRIANGDVAHTEPFGSGQIPDTDRWYTAFIVTEKDDRTRPRVNKQDKHRIRLKLQDPNYQQG